MSYLGATAELVDAMRVGTAIHPTVALVQMPFATTVSPSIGLGLLKAELSTRGIGAEVRYLNFLLEDLIGEECYARISQGEPQNADLLGEWIFSAAARGGVGRGDDELYFERVLFGGDVRHRKSASRDVLQQAKKLAQRGRAHVDAFLDQCMAQDWSQYRIVGFTSVFQQHTPSLALARRLKQRFPDLVIVMGGANCEGDMGRATLAAFDVVDAVCTGEGDVAFPDYVAAVLAGTEPAVRGMLTRADLAAGTATTSARQAVMDRLPYPDYDDYFAQRGGRERHAKLAPRILFESSRGCWWGQKNHCTFCGLNGQGMNFRHKSSARAIDEIQHLVDRYGVHTSRVSATDNIIPHSYFRDFLPRLAELGLDLDIFYETKANLTKDQLRLYKAAGLHAIQPGIESLQTDVLKLMRKGITALQNIRLLKWCAELRIVPHWNYLYGFPGETAASYAQAARLVPQLRHLRPPTGVARLRYDRFSPFVESPATFGIRNMRPYPAYGMIYPQIPVDDIAGLAYFFVADFDGDDRIADYTAPLVAAIATWTRSDSDPFLVHFPHDGGMVVVDGRCDDRTRVYRLSPDHALILELCDGIVSADRIVEDIEDRISADDVADCLADLCAAGIVIADDDHYLALSVPFLSDYQMTEAAMERLRSALGRPLPGDAVAIEKGGAMDRIDML